MVKEELLKAVSSFEDYAWIHIKEKPRKSSDEEARLLFNKDVEMLIATIIDVNLKLTKRQTFYLKWGVSLEQIQVPKIMAGFVEPYSVKFADDDDSEELLIRTPNFQKEILKTEEEYTKALAVFARRMMGKDGMKQMEYVSFASLRKQLLWMDAYIYGEVDGQDGKKFVRRMQGGFLPLTLKAFTTNFWISDVYNALGTDMIDKYFNSVFQ